MGQQFYVIRNNPAPNTEAARAKERRDAEKARRHGKDPATNSADTISAGPETPAPPPAPPQRQQPKRQSRSQRKGGQPKPAPKPTTEQTEQGDTP
jgi:YidC/Oxa1 family membrane protein insertase